VWYGIGLDAGYLLAHDSETANVGHGLVVRAFVTLPYVLPYARFGHVFDYDPLGSFGEFGILVKIPVLLREDP
jgi:hypothetical protein